MTARRTPVDERVAIDQSSTGRPSSRSAGAVVAALVLAVVFAACGSSTASSAAPSAASPAIQPTRAPETPSQAPATAAPPTQAAAPSPSAAAPASGSAAADPTTGMKIEAPYALEDLDALSASALSSGLQKGLGSFASVVKIGVKQVTQGADKPGILLVMAFPGVPGATAATFLESVVGGSIASTNSKIVKRASVNGHPVIVASSASGAFAAYQRGEGVAFVYAPTAAAAEAIVTAVIKASE